MKKLFAIALIAISFAACNGAETTEENTETPEATHEHADGDTTHNHDHAEGDTSHNH